MKPHMMRPDLYPPPSVSEVTTIVELDESDISDDEDHTLDAEGNPRIPVYPSPLRFSAGAGKSATQLQKLTSEQEAAQIHEFYEKYQNEPAIKALGPKKAPPPPDAFTRNAKVQGGFVCENLEDLNYDPAAAALLEAQLSKMKQMNDAAKERKKELAEAKKKIAQEKKQKAIERSEKMQPYYCMFAVFLILLTAVGSTSFLLGDLNNRIDAPIGTPTVSQPGGAPSTPPPLSSPTIALDPTPSPTTLFPSRAPTGLPTTFPSSRPSSTPTAFPTEFPTLSVNADLIDHVEEFEDGDFVSAEIRERVNDLCAESSGLSNVVSFCIDSAHLAQCSGSGEVLTYSRACEIGFKCGCEAFTRIRRDNPCSKDLEMDCALD